MSVHYYNVRLDLDGPHVRADVFCVDDHAQIGTGKPSAIVIASSPSEALATAVNHITSHCLVAHGAHAIPVPIIDLQLPDTLVRLSSGPDFKIGHPREEPSGYHVSLDSTEDAASIVDRACPHCGDRACPHCGDRACPHCAHTGGP